MTPADQQVVHALPLFQGLDPRLLERLLGASSIRRCPKGEITAREGAPAGCLHLILSGSVEAFTSVSGREHVLLIFSPYDLIMPAAALTKQPYLASARALKLTRLLMLDAGAVRKEMARCPHLTARLLAILAGQFRSVFRHLKDDRVRSGPQRLAAFLLRLISEGDIRDGAELPFAKGTLASRLGMTPETMSRSLAALPEHGLVVRGHRVVLRDRTKAELFCNPDPLIDGLETATAVRAW